MHSDSIVQTMLQVWPAPYSSEQHHAGHGYSKEEEGYIYRE